MDSIRKSLRICFVAFRKMIRTPRFYVAFLWFACLIGLFAMPVRNFCIATGIDVAPWMFPLLTEEDVYQLFIIIGAMILFCDAPFLHADSSWQILRAGRKNWFWGNILYIWLLSLLYAVGLSLIPIFLMLPHVKGMPGWGKILGSLAQTNAAAQIGVNGLNYDIMAQYDPLQAMVLTILPVWLNTLLIGMVNYVFNFWTIRGAGAGVSAAIGLSPLLIKRLAKNRIGYYISPPLWMNLSYYKKGNYGIGPSFVYAYGVLLILILACTLISYIGVCRKDLNMMEDI